MVRILSESPSREDTAPFRGVDRSYGATDSDERNEPEDPPPPLVADEEETVARLTRRLRCLFSIVTWPIIPMGTAAVVSLLYFLYAAIFRDGFVSSSCSHPLHVYAIISFVLGFYTFFHPAVRRRLTATDSTSNNERTARSCDQIFHTFAIFYVYWGVTLVQSCEDDADNSDVSTCEVTCPHLYKALVEYTNFLELFVFSLILPLLCLPCVYLWFMRNSSMDAESISILHERLQDEDAFRRNDNIRAQDIVNRLEKVKLMSDGEDVKVLPASSEDWSASTTLDSNECCICMESLMSGDAEAGMADSVIRTPQCHHIFHERCFAQWVSGRWQVEENQRARRTTCPLCRADLRS